jgi:23S rRNA pseudouridine1911/1915/1917 synthase
VELRLKTGRTHQIRVHMAFIGHPVVGDLTYGRAKNEFGIKRQLLHARTLGFVHPRTGKYVEFRSELPEDFRKVLRKLELKN